METGALGILLPMQAVSPQKDTAYRIGAVRDDLLVRSQFTPDSADSVVEKTRDEVKPPRKFVVLMHNDDYTTMEFVVQTLVEVFRKNVHDAVQVMLDIHNEGVGECGRYTAEVAETKMDEVHSRAKEAGFPLRCTMEEE